LGVAFFPQTDAGQFTINMKAPTGSRIELTQEYVANIEKLIRQTVGPDLKMVVSNIGIVPDFSALYTNNAGPYTATVQAALNDDHKVSTFDYMDRVQNAIAQEFPEVRTFVQTGSMVDATLNAGMPAPIDVQVTGRSNRQDYELAQELGSRVRKISGVGQVYIPQDINYPAVRMDIDRVH